MSAQERLLLLLVQVQESSNKNKCSKLDSSSSSEMRMPRRLVEPTIVHFPPRVRPPAGLSTCHGRSDEPMSPLGWLTGRCHDRDGQDSLYSGDECAKPLSCYWSKALVLFTHINTKGSQTCLCATSPVSTISLSFLPPRPHPRLPSHPDVTVATLS